MQKIENLSLDEQSAFYKKFSGNCLGFLHEYFIVNKEWIYAVYKYIHGDTIVNTTILVYIPTSQLIFRSGYAVFSMSNSCGECVKLDRWSWNYCRR